MDRMLSCPTIWCPSAAVGTQVYVAFRRVIELSRAPAEATLRLFADTRYRLWINGQFVEDGPCRFDPRAPAYDELDVTRHFRAGRNAVAVLVHHYALNQFKEWFQLNARMMHHEPGLMADLEIQPPHGEPLVVESDAQWRCCSRTAVLPSPYSYSSIPDNIDARLDCGDWTSADFDDSAWERAVLCDSSRWGAVRPRPIPLLRRVEFPTKALNLNGKHGNSWLPMTLEAGSSILADVGRAVQAYADIEFDAEQGSEILIEYASSLSDDGHTLQTGRPWVGGMSRYIARQGRQNYLSGDTFGFRYLRVELRSGRLTMHRLGVIDRRYPFRRAGSFACSDALLNKAWEFSVNTVELCSEDAFVDCADRERAQWIGDGAMVGFRSTHVALAAADGADGVKSDTRLFEKMLRDVAASQLPDGRLQPMRPSDYPPDKKHGVIEDYSCLWVHGLRDLYERSGDSALVSELLPAVKRQMDHVLRHRTDCGLVEMEEFIIFTNPMAYQRCQGTGINACAYIALRDAARLCAISGDTSAAEHYQQAADCLRSAMNELLWDDQWGSYSAGILSGARTPPSAHAAIMALFAGVAPPARQGSALRFIREQYDKPLEQRLHRELEPMTLAYTYYFQALYQVDQADADQHVFDLIRTKWPQVLRDPTRTTAEGFAQNNVGGCSVLHNFGAVPAYYLSSYVLGVRSEGTRENRRLIIEPRLGDLQWARGTVMTEWGPVAVEWDKRPGDGLHFSIALPAGRHACLALPSLGEGSFLRLAEPVESGVERAGRWMRLQVPGGTVRGQMVCPH